MIAHLAALLLAAPGATPLGPWRTEDGSAIVLVAPCGAALCGRIDRILKRDPKAPATDINNPDPKLRGRAADRIVIMSGFMPDGARWRGRIYDPRSGRTYTSFIAASGATLDVRGCVLMLCRSQTWRRP